MALIVVVLVSWIFVDTLLTLRELVDFYGLVCSCDCLWSCLGCCFGCFGFSVFARYDLLGGVFFSLLYGLLLGIYVTCDSFDACCCLCFTMELAGYHWQVFSLGFVLYFINVVFTGRGFC